MMLGEELEAEPLRRCQLHVEELEMEERHHAFVVLLQAKAEDLEQLRDLAL